MSPRREEGIIGFANWMMGMNTLIKFGFPSHSTEAVSSAAVEALKTLGHEVVASGPGDPPCQLKVDFRAKRGGSFDDKTWELSILDVGGEPRAIVTRYSGFFKGNQRKVNDVALEIFNSMDVLLA